MAIPAALVKALRQRTGAGMMDCKQALEQAGGDMAAAMTAMRTAGLARAAEKAGRIAAEGVISLTASADGHRALLLEVNAETDFVARDESFLAFVGQVAATIMAESPADVAALSTLPLNDEQTHDQADKAGNGKPQTIEQARQALITRIGENISIRRFTLVHSVAGALGTYLHGGRIGVVVVLTAADDELAKDLAMHIAASKPLCVGPAEVPAALLEEERAILTEQAQASGKPPAIIEQMVSGRLRKFVNEITLTGQPFVKQPDLSVAELLQRHAAEVQSFVRFELGEGIARQADNFAEDVIRQAGISPG